MTYCSHAMYPLWNVSIARKCYLAQLPNQFPCSSRMTDKVTRVGPYQIPPGVLVSVPLYALHNARHNWASPLIFRPERWLEIPAESFVYSTTDPHADRHDSITYMPFSEGHRNCAGQSLAKMEVLVFMAKLLSAFQLVLAPEVS